MHFKNTDMARWGVGEGTLPSLSVDENFWLLLERIVGLEEEPPEPNSIVSITSDASTLTVHLTDGATFTVALPFPHFTMLGEWQPLTLYNTPGSFVSYGGKTYLIEVAHTSAAFFDPGANDGLGHNLYELLPFPDTPIIEWIGDYPAGDAVGQYKLFSVPDSGVYLTLIAHTAAATFDPLAEDGGGNPLYQQIFGSLQTNLARIQFQYPGTPPSDGSLILKYINDDTRDLVIPEFLSGSVAHLEVATSTQTLVYRVMYAGDEIGTFTFAPGELLDGDGGQFATFDGTGATVASLELLRVLGPSLADATAVFLTLSIIATYSEGS